MRRLLQSTSILAPTYMMAALFPSSMVLAEDITVDTTIKTATLYESGGASITRSGTVKLPAGKHTLHIYNLHEDLLDGDVPPRLSFSSPGITILDTRYADQPSSTAASPLQRDISQKIIAVENDIRALNSSKKIATMQLSLLQSLGNQRGRQTAQSASPDLADIEKTITYVGTKAHALMADLVAVDNEIDSKKQSLDALKRELERAGESRLDYKSAELSVDVASSLETTLSLDYYLEDTEWGMTLEADLDTDKKRVSLRQLASVTQETGEAWNNIALALSNSTPNTELSNLELYPSYVDFAPEIQPSIRSKSIDSVEEIVVSPMKLAVNTGYERLYLVSGKSNLPSDGSHKQILLKTDSFPVELVTRATPKLSPSAFLYADTTLENFDSLRNIEATVSRNGHFTGEGMWPSLRAGTPLELPFGENKNITINYVEQQASDGTKGFISKDLVDERRFQIIVKNTGEKSEVIEIFDQLPVSGNEDIKVARLKEATKPSTETYEGRPGVISWKKTVAPNETWTINHYYMITYPDGKKILER